MVELAESGLLTLTTPPRHVIGVITPSGNTVVERVTTSVVRQFPDVSCHFSRTGVMGSVDPFPEGYDWDSMLTAAKLLSHAAPHILTWSGSKAGSIAFDLDRELQRRISEETGLHATSSTLGLIDVLQSRGYRRLGLVSPYTFSYQSKILATFAREGLPIVAHACSELSDNLSFAAVGAEDIRRMTRRVADAGPEAIIAWCTNFMAAPLAASLEAETGIPFLDSTTLAIWHPLHTLGYDTTAAASWGSLFSGAMPAPR